jgi:hypothetical protein
LLITMRLSTIFHRIKLPLSGICRIL